MDIHIKQQSTAFKARPGHTMLKFISKEFNGDKNKIEKFKKLFENVHQQYTNKNTIIDIDSRGNLIYSNTSFPGIIYCYKTNSSHQSSLSEKLLNECPKTIASGENTFFHHVIVIFCCLKTIKANCSAVCFTETHDVILNHICFL